MGLKKFFRMKPPEEDTVEENRTRLQDIGITTKNPNKVKREKFSAYGKFARDKTNDKIYAPPGYEQYARPSTNDDDLNDVPEDLNGMGNVNNNNNAIHQVGQDPYGMGSGDSSGYDGGFSPPANDPYAISTTKSSNNYGDPYANVKARNSPYTADGSSGYTEGYNDAYRSSAAANQRSNPYDAMPAKQNQSYGISNYNEQQTSETVPSQRNDKNPYSGFDPTATSSGRITVSNSNKNAQKTGTPNNTNPYASMQSEGGGSNPAMETNSYGDNSRPQGQFQAYNEQPRELGSQSRYKPASSSRLARTNTQMTEDLNKTVSRREEPMGQYNNRNNQFDFEASDNIDDDYIRQPSQMQSDELDLNATDECRGDNLNAAPELDSYSGQQQQQQQAQQEKPYWEEENYDRFEDHDYGATDYGYGQAPADRGYKTFEELQKEEEEAKQREEDEEVDEVKQEIKFVKQSSVASTRNTLKMAQEAEMAGMNTLGMLGHQSEKLNSIETNLNLMKVQNVTADDKVAELKKLNRSLLAVHVKNPFTSKRRQMEREEKLKGRKIEERLMNERTNQDLYHSTQRIENALTDNAPSEVREKYKREEILQRSKKYQFENDEEDDAMEVEIDKNLDKIQQVSSRLKKLAIASGQEVDSQQTRVKDIEETADELDIKIHMNTMRLANIR